VVPARQEIDEADFVFVLGELADGNQAIAAGAA
jgi:hypothetical protein